MVRFQLATLLALATFIACVCGMLATGRSLSTQTPWTLVTCALFGGGAMGWLTARNSNGVLFGAVFGLCGLMIGGMVGHGWAATVGEPEREVQVSTPARWGFSLRVEEERHPPGTTAAIVGIAGVMIGSSLAAFIARRRLNESNWARGEGS
jgi:hypothetical protein